jgi:hypothetical protein
MKKLFLIVGLVCLLASPAFAQRIPGPCGVSNLSAGSFTFSQSAQGNPTNQAATCGTNAATTCVVTATISAGHALIISLFTGNQQDPISSMTSCGTFSTIGGTDQNGVTNTNFQYIYIPVTSSCSNPTFTFGQNHNGAIVTIYDWSVSAGTPALDAYGAKIFGSGTASPMAGIALTCTGTSEVDGQVGWSFGNGVTAVASPYNTKALFASAGNIAQAGATVVTNNSPICPTPSWTEGASPSFSSVGGIALELGGTPAVDISRNDSHSGTVGTQPTAATLAADSYGFLAVGGNGAHSGVAYIAGTSETDLTYATDISGSLPSCLSVHFAGNGGSTAACSGTTVFSLASCNIGCPSVGGEGVVPPAGTRLFTDSIYLWTNIPSNATAGQQTLGQVANGADTMGLNIITTGSALTVVPEYNGGDACSLALTPLTISPSTWYRVTRFFHSSVGGNGTVTIYSVPGNTQLATWTCTNTTAADIQVAAWPGRNGAESMNGTGHITEWWDWVWDRTGTNLFTTAY